MKAVKRFKVAKTEKKKRRPFTIDELKATFRVAPDGFWRYMVIGGTYTGLSLGDLIILRAGEIDFAQNQLVLERGKTGVPLHIPIASPLLVELKALLTIRKKWQRDDFLWPEQAAVYLNHGRKPKAGPFSQDFYERVLVPAGLVAKRTHKKRKDTDPNHGRRAVNEISFHSFRHSFISMLKLSGASQSIAKELAGHSSDAVSDLYTTIPADVLRKAVEQLPDVSG